MIPSEEEIANWKAYNAKAEKELEKRIAHLERAKIYPIPKEKYADYHIKEVKTCEKCNSPLFPHAFGAVRIGNQWYDFLQIFSAVMKRVDDGNLS